MLPDGVKALGLGVNCNFNLYLLFLHGVPC